MNRGEGPARQPRAADWSSVAEARSRILAETPDGVGAEIVPLLAAQGRVLSKDVRASIAHPPWDNSAMDGFAVRSKDVARASADEPVVLELTEEVRAGSFPSRRVDRGEAIKVMTGAPVPEGADGVTRLEHTEPGPRPNTIRIISGDDAGRNIRRKGEDLEAGALAVEAGRLVGAAEIGVLAMVGRPTVPVYRRPRVAVLSTGDELADFHELPLVASGRRIMNSNSYAVAAQVREAGAEPVLLGIARDDRESLRRHLEGVRGCDALVTSAGLAVGEHDYIKEVLDEMGMRFLFYRVRTRPGSPFTFGTLESTPVFALPGNPVSAMVAFEVFARPALRKLAGAQEIDRPRHRVVLGEPIASTNPELTHYYRVALTRSDSGESVARLTGPQGSGILTSVARADALLELPEGVAEVPEGSYLDAIVLREV